MKKYISVMTLSLICLLNVVALAQTSENKVDPTKKMNIEKLLAISNYPNLNQQTFDAFFALYGKVKSKIPEVLWKEIVAMIDNERKTHSLNLVIPIYDKYLTSEDIIALIHFYESPTGKKVLLARSKAEEENKTQVDFNKYLTADEMSELTKFLTTNAAGKKFNSLRPQINKEAMEEAHKLGRNLAGKLQNKLREKGYSIQAKGDTIVFCPGSNKPGECFELHP